MVGVARRVWGAVACWAGDVGTARRAAAQRAAVRVRMVGMNFIYHRVAKDGETTLVKWEITAWVRLIWLDAMRSPLCAAKFLNRI